MRRPVTGIIALAMLASACAFPTESPNWDMTWNLPVPDDNGMSIGVKTFLPSGVDTVTPAGTSTRAFRANVSSVPAINRTLGVQCPTCPSATAPKPAFTAPPATSTISLTAGTALTSATLFTGSQVAVTLTNGFTFDPINPPGGSPGTLTLTVSNGATTLGTLTLQGPAQTIPAGQSKLFTITLAGTFNTAQPLTIGMTMDSPAGAAGSPVAMNPAQLFTAAAVPTINIASANVSIAAQTFPAGTPTPIDLAGTDSSIVNRIVNDTQNRGTMYLTLTNPLTIGADATITFRSPTGTPVAEAIVPITKTLTVPAAANATTASVSTVAINLTGQELRRMFGRKIEAVFGGNTKAGAATVTPAQKISVTSRIQVNFTIREQ